MRQPVTCTKKYHKRKNCHNLHNYTHGWFTLHSKLLHTTKFPHHNESIKNRFHQFVSFYPLVQSETSKFKHKFQVNMDTYTLDMIPLHQMDILILNFAHDPSTSSEYFLLWSNITTTTRNHYFENIPHWCTCSV